MSGKGDKPRPKSVDDKTYGENWERVFGKKDADPIPEWAPTDGQEL